MPTGHVGIFWRIAMASGPHLLTDSVPVDQAEPYGEFQTHGGHYEFWCRLASLPATKRREAGIPDAVRWSEYEEWPRGRVVYHAPTNRFVLYADRKLLKPDILAKIMQRFSLAADQTDIRPDPHYVSVR